MVLTSKGTKTAQIIKLCVPLRDATPLEAMWGVVLESVLLGGYFRFSRNVRLMCVLLLIFYLVGEVGQHSPKYAPGQERPVIRGRVLILVLLDYAL